MSKPRMPFVLPVGVLGVLLLRPPRHVIKWHKVDDWAREVLEPSDVIPYRDRFKNPRIAGYTGLWVTDLDDEEEASTRGVPFSHLTPLVPPGPGRHEGGFRQVSIRVLAWDYVKINGVGYSLDPRWLTVGWGFSASEACARYARKIQHMPEQYRHIIVTAREIVFWTAGKDADYV